MIFSKEQRKPWDDIKLGLVFGFFGGYCNAVAIVLLLYGISPMSGTVGKLATAIGQMNFSEIIVYIPLVFCFTVGAFIGAKWVKRGNPFHAVMAEAALLLSTAFIAKDNFIFAVSIGGFAMGVQNGMTTQLTGGRLRTTHLTGTITDMGISLARKDYKDVLIQGSRVLTFIWGVIVGGLKASFLGTTAFVLGGVYLFFVASAFHLFLPRCAGCQRRDSLLEEWFFRTNASLTTIATEN